MNKNSAKGISFALKTNNKNETKILKIAITKALKEFLSGNYEKSMGLIESLSSRKLSKKLRSRLRKVLDMMLIGEFYGLHTLRSILESLEVKSSNMYKLWNEHTYLQVKNMVSRLSVDYFTESLKELMGKSESSWSRSSVTIIADDSIFKQWLKNMVRGDKYAKFFSGQHHNSVYGFRVQLVGVALKDAFHPLFYQLVGRKEQSKKAVTKLIKKVQRTFEQLADKQGFRIPNLYLSVDSGFTDEDLIRFCKSKDVGFIGVPKKNNIFTIDGDQVKLKSYIEAEYLEQEKLAKKIKSEEPFLLRKKAFYHSQNIEVVLLFFRLKGSNKVTVIFSTDVSIMAKTLRRRFFQRTKIELFFRFLKDTLKIQKSKSVDSTSFVKKLSLFILKAVICMQFERYCRKKYRRFKGWAFTRLRHHIIYQDLEKTMLENLIKPKPFAT